MDATETDMSDFDRLASEVVCHILGYLGYRELGRVAQTCRRLHHLAMLDSLWERLCVQDFQFASKDGWGSKDTTFCNIYSEVLHHFGKCQGLWMGTSIPYGLFVNVKEESGRFVARLCKYPQTYDIRDVLEWSVPVFTVALTEGKGRLTCRKGCCEPVVHMDFEDEGNRMIFKCDNCYSHSESIGESALMQEWAGEVMEETDIVFRGSPDLILKNAAVAKTTKLMSSYTLERLPPTVQWPGSPIRLGLYKGTYGAHGTEVIHLRMDDTATFIHGQKILGDPNVPAGVISMYINLRQPVSTEQQDLDLLNGIYPETLPSVHCFPPQYTVPFSLPNSVHVRHEEPIPTMCKARYAGQGQIAAYGYKYTEKIPGQFVAFSETLFGFHWINLHSFSFFRLAEEIFS